MSNCIFYNKCQKCLYYNFYGDCYQGLVKPYPPNVCEYFDCRYSDSCDLMREGKCGEEEEDD